MSGTSSNKYIKRDLNLDIGFEKFEEDFQANPNTMFIVPNESKDKPIKVIFEDDVKVTASDNNIEIKRKLSDIEAEKLLIDIFGTTNIGILDCSDIKDCDSCKHSYEEMDRDGYWRLYCFKKWDDEDGSLVSPYNCCDKFESK